MRTKKPDYTFLVSMAILILLGLVMLTSASGPIAYQKFGDTYWYLKHQVLFGILPGIFAFFIMARIDYRKWRRLAVPMFFLSMVMLLLVFLPGIGADWGTSNSWINIGSFSFQPAEMVKLTILIYLALIFERRTIESGNVDEGFVPFLVVLGLASLLILLQPDLGSLSVILATAFLVYFIAGAPWKHIIGLCAGAVVLVGIMIKTAPYRAARLMTFLHPELDPLGIGYHINQAFLAIGSGGLFGVGLGHSRQKFLYLPEVVGDSIFAVMAEELGFILTVAALGVIIMFVLRGVSIAKRAPDLFGKLLAAGVVGWIFFQSFFNIGSMVGILPVTGLPLPFMSYGGTALMVLMGAVGLVTNISMHAKPRVVRRR